MKATCIACNRALLPPPPPSPYQNFSTDLFHTFYFFLLVQLICFFSPERLNLSKFYNYIFFCVNLSSGALLLALLYLDSGGYFLRKDAEMQPSQSRLASNLVGDLGRFLAMIIDGEVRRAAGAQNATPRHSSLRLQDSATGTVQRSRQFQQHADTLLAERRQRAATVAEWLSTLDSLDLEQVLTFQWLTNQVCLRFCCFVFC